MNKQLEQYARSCLKENLAKIPSEMHNIFKRMYSHNDLDKDINDIVDDMECDKLDLAMQQVQLSILIDK